jgi:hypothetical protein
VASASSVITYRPRRLVTFSFVSSLCLLGLSLFGWFALPPALRDLFTVSQIVTLLIILFGLIAVLAIIGSSNVRVDDTGLRIRNGLSRHVVSWPQVHKFVFRPGDPWAVVLIKPDAEPFVVDADAERRMLMGIQAGDGAEEAVAALTDRLRRRLS